MKKFVFLSIFLVGGLFSTTPRTVLAQGGNTCCFNTILQGHTCFSYILVEWDGSSRKVNVPGIRIPCIQE
ncbi:MAG: hypothetical protein ACI9UV_002056 [Algoriphagus sp.]|jgi:hypothetical protein